EGLGPFRIGRHQLVPDEVTDRISRRIVGRSWGVTNVRHDVPPSKWVKRLGRHWCAGAGRVDNRLEPAPEHAAAVEQAAAMLHSVVRHDLLPRLITRGLVRPFDEGESDGLAVLRLHGAIEVGNLAAVYVVAERFDHTRRAIFDEDL